MGKWLLAGGLALVGLLAFMLIQLKSEAAAPPAPAAPAKTEPVAVLAAKAAEADKMKAELAKVAEARKLSGKIDPASDEFFHRYDDVVPQILSRSAAKCYTGGLNRVHRNAKVKLSFTNKIVNGDAFVTDVKVVESDTTISDPQMIACFVREVAATRWHDDELPDYSAPDELVIRPERGLKKHMPDNINYVGEEAPVRPPIQEPGEDMK